MEAKEDSYHGLHPDMRANAEMLTGQSQGFFFLPAELFLNVNI